MKKKVLHAAAHSALAFAALFVFASAGVSAQQVASNATRERTATTPKRMAISVGQSAQGSRVRITSDAPLEGYEAFARDGKFYVLIHGADASDGGEGEPR